MRRRTHQLDGSDAESSPDLPLREALRPSGPARLKVEVDSKPDVMVLTIEGEVDLLTAPRLAARLTRVIRESEGDVVLDLHNVEFMDSAGMQILLNVRRRLLRASRTLSVICDDGPVKQVIQFARLTDTLGVIDA
jgi:anti-sigma B factor antagonist